MTHGIYNSAPAVFSVFREHNYPDFSFDPTKLCVRAVVVSAIFAEFLKTTDCT